MIAKKKVTVKTQFFLSEDEREKAYYELAKRKLSVTAYAKLTKNKPSTIQKILNGQIPLTPLTYSRAFKELNCIDELPEKFENV